MNVEEQKECYEKLGYTFQDPHYLELALTHSSAKSADRPSNERLEFLGDAVLGMMISERLYRRFEDHTEGQLTRIKSVVVSSRALGVVTQRLGMDVHIKVGKGISAKKDLPQSLAGNVYEALVAAIYLDGGVEVAREFVERTLRDEIHRVLENKHAQNYKSQLQHFVQKCHGSVPSYCVLAETGPDHHKTFRVGVFVEGEMMGTAWGRNKKDAEQKAARLALNLVRAQPRNGEPIDFELDEEDSLPPDDRPGAAGEM